LFTNTDNSKTTAIMADGIDRKAEEKMEFTTSKDVVVSPTFQDMHLKGTIELLELWSILY